MRVQVFANTPAHAHVYKHAVAALRDGGHDVRVLARDYGCTHDVLEYHDVPFASYGYCGTTPTSLLARLPGHYARIAVATRRFDPDVVFGMGAYAAHAGALARAPVVLLLDSEPTSLDHAISRPFARSLLTPSAFTKDLGDRHYVFDGFKESAYLHPDVFSPDPSVRDRLDLDGDGRYAIVRFNAFGSHHDLGKQGFTPEQRRELIRELAEHATVLVSDEGDDLALADLPARPFDLHPALLHDALAGADLLVADTQTMVTEAALLGTPAVRSNAFVGDGDMGNFRELERAGLVENEATFDGALATARDLLADETAARRWRERRDHYVADMVDLTDVIVEAALARGRLAEVSGVESYGSAERHVAPVAADEA